MFRKSIHVLLFLLILLQTGVMMLAYKAEQTVAKYNMKEILNLHTTPTQTLIVSLAEFNVLKTNTDEITIAGKLYDIKTYEIKGSDVVITAVNDTDEERIVQQMEELDDNEDDKVKTDHFINLLTLDYVIPATLQLTFYPLQDGHSYLSHVDAVASRIQEHNSPPPKTV